MPRAGDEICEAGEQGEGRALCQKGREALPQQKDSGGSENILLGKSSSQLYLFQVLNLVEQMGLGEEEKSEGGSRGERERSAEQSHDNEEASTSSLPKNFTQEQVGQFDNPAYK